MRVENEKLVCKANNAMCVKVITPWMANIVVEDELADNDDKRIVRCLTRLLICHNSNDSLTMGGDGLSGKISDDEKARRLKEAGSWCHNHEKVRDETFLENDFFDPRDIVQVKYEMLRKVEKEGVPVTRAAAAFGFSRTAFYQAKEAFSESGLSGLLPKRRGPRRAHKLSDEVLDFITERMDEEKINAFKVAPLVEERFGISVHPRSIQRALSRRRQKKGPRRRRR